MKSTNSFSDLNRLSARTATADGSACSAGSTMKSSGPSLPSLVAIANDMLEVVDRMV